MVVNKPSVLTRNNFYISIFKIPEVLNRLRLYRQLLQKHHINIPIWVYCLTQDIKTLRGTPHPEVVNFLVSLGLFDRYVSKKGWPDYLIGSHPFASVVSGESTFEDMALNLSKPSYNYEEDLFLMKTKSYYDSRIKNYCLTSLKFQMQSIELESILEFIDKDRDEDSPFIYQLLNPHETEFFYILKSFSIYPREFLEWDSELKWLWPIWKKTQIYHSHQEANSF